MSTVEFKYEKGAKAKSRITGITGIITSRCDLIYGCNRYFVEPPLNEDGTFFKGRYMDEDEIEIIPFEDHEQRP